MRESLWRSLAPSLLLGSALLASGACAPQIPPNSKPPPCLPGDRICPLTGACQLDAPTSDPEELFKGCPARVEVRQGDSVVLSAPGASASGVVLSGFSPDDKLTARVVPSAGGIGVVIEAPHGTLAGSGFANDSDRVLKIQTTIKGRKPFTREIPIVVSNIFAAPWGDNRNTGTVSHPFATFQAAAKVAGPGDTIFLRSVPPTETPKPWLALPPLPLPGADTTPLDVNSPLPAGVTVSCRDPAKVVLSMGIELAGDATFENISFEGPRLVIRHPSTVTFINDRLKYGVTIDSGAPTVAFTQNTQIFNDGAESTEAPLLVTSNGANVTVDGSGVKLTNEGAKMVEAIRVNGNDTTVSITGGSEVTNAAGLDAVNVTGVNTTVNLASSNFFAPVTVSGSATVTIVGSKFMAPLTVNPGRTSVTASSATFVGAGLIFQGQVLKLVDNTTLTNSPFEFGGQTLTVNDTTFDASGITATSQDPVVIDKGMANATLQNVTFKSAPVTFQGNQLAIQGLTTFNNSLLTFQGHALTATDTVFLGGQQTIVQEASNSVATLQNVTIANYTRSGYWLRTGQVNIEQSNFTHGGVIQPGQPGDACSSSPPWALRIDAEADSDSLVNSIATRYDTVMFMPNACDLVEGSACEIVGPKCAGSVFTISQAVRVSFSL